MAEEKEPASKRGPGRPPSGIPRDEQLRRAQRRRRESLCRLDIDLTEEESQALDVVAANHPRGKKGWVHDLIIRELRKRDS